jgi:hypothetical protein
VVVLGVMVMGLTAKHEIDERVGNRMARYPAKQ